MSHRCVTLLVCLKGANNYTNKCMGHHIRQVIPTRKEKQVGDQYRGQASHSHKKRKEKQVGDQYREQDFFRCMILNLN